MSTDRIQSKPNAPPPPKPVQSYASTQDTSAFAARLKKSSAEQGRSAKNSRRDEEKSPASASSNYDDSSCGVRGMAAVTAAAGREHDGQDEEGGNSWNAVSSADESDEFETDTLADQLAPLSANDGLFEVLLPTGKKLSVAVTVTANRLRFLLSSDADDLNEQIKRKKKELEQRIGRRTGKDVNLSVL
ncbi:hypothetical protein [Actimicrobium sp. CCI2.3]|uniref:hypothetical protein n=1 Tax=Actimicrobium sp. CCI2.3 TaxID=3048616 RepID=UPI002B255A7C|nr:hypothetical protein [Actimicrobium sp. CCI2.3]MEB0022227.1 hypothetical protein [Actimicrobium sp. CCI2.3]